MSIAQKETKKLLKRLLFITTAAFAFLMLPLAARSQDFSVLRNVVLGGIQSVAHADAPTPGEGRGEGVGDAGGEGDTGEGGTGGGEGEGGDCP